MVTQCKPLTKDHLLLKTAFAGTKEWSVVTGFTVVGITCTVMYVHVRLQASRGGGGAVVLLGSSSSVFQPR